MKESNGCVRINDPLTILVTFHRIGLVFFQNVRLNLLYLNVLIVKCRTNLLQHKIMKSKDLQKLVLSKYGAGQTPKKIFQDLNGTVRNDGVR